MTKCIQHNGSQCHDTTLSEPYALKHVNFFHKYRRRKSHVHSFPLPPFDKEHAISADEETRYPTPGRSCPDGNYVIMVMSIPSHPHANRTGYLLWWVVFGWDDGATLFSPSCYYALQEKFGFLENSSPHKWIFSWTTIAGIYDHWAVFEYWQQCRVNVCQSKWLWSHWITCTLCLAVGTIVWIYWNLVLGWLELYIVN